MPAAAARSPHRRDPWAVAVESLERAETDRERAEALLTVAGELSSRDPDLARFRFSLLASLRSALAAEEVAERLGGAPRITVDEIELPAFDPSDMAREALVRGSARARVLDEELLTASAVSLLLGSRSKNPRQYANRLRVRSEIVGVPYQNQFLYPRFQFDEASSSVMPAVRSVNELLDATHDPWGVASWWVSPHGALGNQPPKALLAEPDGAAKLLEIASDAVAGE